jgi:hypothetical protein
MDEEPGGLILQDVRVREPLVAELSYQSPVAASDA